jgi:hypothetical protein
VSRSELICGGYLRHDIAQAGRFVSHDGFSTRIVHATLRKR